MVEVISEQLLVVILAIIIGTLAAIVYSLRILVVMDRKVERIEYHIERMVNAVLREELKIEKRVGSAGKKKR